MLVHSDWNGSTGKAETIGIHGLSVIVIPTSRRLRLGTYQQRTLPALQRLKVRGSSAPKTKWKRSGKVVGRDGFEPSTNGLPTTLSFLSHHSVL